MIRSLLAAVVLAGAMTILFTAPAHAQKTSAGAAPAAATTVASPVVHTAPATPPASVERPSALAAMLGLLAAGGAGESDPLAPVAALLASSEDSGPAIQAALMAGLVLLGSGPEHADMRFGLTALLAQLQSGAPPSEVRSALVTILSTGARELQSGP